MINKLLLLGKLFISNISLLIIYVNDYFSIFLQQKSLLH